MNIRTCELESSTFAEQVLHTRVKHVQPVKSHEFGLFLASSLICDVNKLEKVSVKDQTAPLAALFLLINLLHFLYSLQSWKTL